MQRYEDFSTCTTLYFYSEIKKQSSTWKIVPKNIKKKTVK